MAQTKSKRYPTCRTSSVTKTTSNHLYKLQSTVSDIVDRVEDHVCSIITETKDPVSVYELMSQYQNKLITKIGRRNNVRRSKQTTRR